MGGFDDGGLFCFRKQPPSSHLNLQSLSLLLLIQGHILDQYKLSPTLILLARVGELDYLTNKLVRRE